MHVEERSFDFIVIGSGPAGQKAAIQAAKLGKRVALVEKHFEIGGAALHSGTIPSKSLREAIINYTDFYKKNYYGQKGRKEKEVSLTDLNFCLSQVIENQVKNLKEQLKKNEIEVIQGHAQFKTSNQITVLDDRKQMIALIGGEKILISSGSKPRNPKDIPFDEKKVLDSNRLLTIDHLPKKMVVLGGGIIGTEYASFFAALGTEVTLIDKRERILAQLDEEIGGHLQQGLSALKLHFIGGKTVDEVYHKGKQVAVKFSDQSEIEAEMLLYALGRKANIDHLHMETIGITVDKKGYIPVNALFQTVVPHIYAAGDVIGGPCLYSTSMEQGRLVARHAFGAETHHFPTFYPVGIYTIPEISFCGYTEEKLKSLGFGYEIGRAYYYEIAKNVIAGNEAGMFKILFHKDTLEILGIHIVGRDATELIHIGQIAMTFNARIDFFIDQVFNYPTYAEGYRIAALNGFNKVKHKR